jgi:hypothetical protein
LAGAFFDLASIRAAPYRNVSISGRADEVIDLARTNLWR